MMFTGFYDDSRDATHFVVAGCISNIRGWRHFDKDWNAVLRRAPRIAPPFKTADFWNLQGDFDPAKSRWTEDRRNRKVGHLCGVVRKHIQVGMAFAVRLGDWKRSGIEDEFSSKDSDPFFMCYYMMLQGMVSLLNNIQAPPGSKVSMVYDEQRSGKANRRAEELFQAEIGELSKVWLQGITARTDDNYSELQAADLLAWHNRSILAGRRDARHDAFRKLGGMYVHHAKATIRDIEQFREVLREGGARKRRGQRRD